MSDAANGETVIGIALSSGGAAGLAHIGVLEELSEGGIDARCVAGTSSGAIIGAAFAAGHLRDLRERMTSLTRRERLALFDPVWPRSGILEGRRAMDLLLRQHIGGPIEKLERRFAAVATNLDSGAEVVLTRGDVIDAVRASIAIPGVFTPQPWEGSLLVDGALSDPIPVRAARQIGATYVIAVNTVGPVRAAGAALDGRERTSSLIEHLLARLLGRNGAEKAASALVPGAPSLDARPECPAAEGLAGILSKASTVIQLNIAASRLRDDPADFVIEPDVAAIGLFDLDRAADAIEAGRAAVRTVLPALRQSIERARKQRAARPAWAFWTRASSRPAASPCPAPRVAPAP